MLDDWGGGGLQLSCGFWLGFFWFFCFFFFSLLENTWTTVAFPSTSSESFSLDRQGVPLPHIGSGANLVQYWAGLAPETCSKFPASCWINFLPLQLLELNCCGGLMTPWVKEVWGGVGEGSVGDFPPESLPWFVGLWILSSNGLPRSVLHVVPLCVCLALCRDDSAAGLAAAECLEVTGCCIKLASVFCLPRLKMLGPLAARLLLRQLHQPHNRSGGSLEQVVVGLVPASSPVPALSKRVL